MAVEAGSRVRQDKLADKNTLIVASATGGKAGYGLPGKQ